VLGVVSVMSFRGQERCAIIACLSGGYQPSRRLDAEKMAKGHF
jgi:hypothetical protein